VVINDWEEECRQSIGAHWEEEYAAPNMVSGYPSPGLIRSESARRATAVLLPDK